MIQAWWEANQFPLLVTGVLFTVLSIPFTIEWVGDVWNERKRKKRDGIL